MFSETDKTIKKDDKSTCKLKVAFIISLLTCSVLLSGCSVFGGNDFSCNRVGGINGCVSMDDAYKMSEDGEISANRAPYSVDGKQYISGGETGAGSFASPSSEASTTTSTLPQAVGGQSGYAVGVPSAGMPVRYGDKIQKVWIFPYQDKSGNYHESAIIYSVVQKSHWVGYPTTAIQNQDEV